MAKSKAPPVTELEFIKLTYNYRELQTKLAKLGLTSQSLRDNAEHLCERWFSLAMEHLREAQVVLSSGCSRSAYSRAYYAAYNASKAVRYLTSGAVSLRGDDHQRAGADLPGDFDDVAVWSGKISALYEHRLRADYDNWLDSKGQNTLIEADAVRDAGDFIAAARRYLKDKHGVSV